MGSKKKKGRKKFKILASIEHGRLGDKKPLKSMFRQPKSDMSARR